MQTLGSDLFLNQTQLMFPPCISKSHLPGSYLPSQMSDLELAWFSLSPGSLHLLPMVSDASPVTSPPSRPRPLVLSVYCTARAYEQHDILMPKALTYAAPSTIVARGLV